MSRRPSRPHFQTIAGLRAPRHGASAGFTLVEMELAFLIGVFLMIVALDAFEASQRISRRNVALTEAQQGGTYALQEAAINIRRAGFGLGGNFAVVRNAGNSSGPGTANSPLASWNNYDPAATGPTIATVNAGDYLPVAGTDGITVRYADAVQPPLHVCYQPNSSTLQVVQNDAYMTPGVYPAANTAFDLVTQNLQCYGYAAVPPPLDVAATNRSQITVNAVAAGRLCNGGVNPVYPADLATHEPACGPVYKPSPTPMPSTCLELTLSAPLPCTNLHRLSRSVLLYPSRTISFWISTEDRSGNLAQSRPVLVSRAAGAGAMAAGANPLLTAPTRVLATDIEDLQLLYYRTVVGAGGNTLAIVGAIPGDPLPANTEMPSVRAVRFDLIARTGVTDLMSKNPAYCAAHAQNVLLFSRPALDDHPAAAAGAPDYCDGFRRVTFSQLINMPNMTALPNGGS